MKKTNKIIMALIGAMMAGPMAGCGSQQAVYEQPGQPPHVEGYKDEYWVWDEDDGEWEYDPPGSRGLWYFYNGRLYKNSIKKSGLISTAPKIQSAKLGGFGSGSKGGGFGG